MKENKKTMTVTKEAAESSMPVIHDSGENKYTFEFELYNHGVLEKLIPIAVLADTEEEGITKARQALETTIESNQQLRYTGKFKREKVVD